MFADYLHRRISPRKSATKLSKIAVSSGTRQNPILVINLTKIGSTLSPEEPRLHAWDRSRFSRGISKVTDSRYKSKEIRKSFGNFCKRLLRKVQQRDWRTPALHGHSTFPACSF